MRGPSLTRHHELLSSSSSSPSEARGQRATACTTLEPEETVSQRGGQRGAASRIRWAAQALLVWAPPGFQQQEQERAFQAAQEASAARQDVRTGHAVFLLVVLFCVRFRHILAACTQLRAVAVASLYLAPWVWCSLLGASASYTRQRLWIVTGECCAGGAGRGGAGRGAGGGVHAGATEAQPHCAAYLIVQQAGKGRAAAPQRRSAR